MTGKGCLAVLLCIGVGFAILLFSGVLSGPHGNRNEGPAWSPNGDRIAFASDRNGKFDIYIMNIDGANVVQLTHDPFPWLYDLQSSEIEPTWSPDGRQIAFVAGNNTGTGNNVNLYLMNADGSNVVQVNKKNSHILRSSWSPNGNQIAYCFERHDDVKFIFIINIDGSDDNPLVNGCMPTWSPDGRRIAFEAHSRDERNGSINLFVVNVDGSNKVALTTDEDAIEMSPAWSPDGKRIAFVSNSGGIYVVNADGSNMIQLTNDQQVEYSEPSWSPDGSKIAFVSDRDGHDNIYVMNADGTNVVQLTGK
jgi:Tol biopolymer transport system component